MKQFQIIATLFVVCLLPTFAFGQFVQSCPHNTSGDNCPDLLYNPADGSVTFEVDGQNQDPNASTTPRPRSISAFSIAHTGNPAWDFTANPLPDVSGLPAGGAFDFISTQFGWVSPSTSQGFTANQVFGPLFPSGLDLAGLIAFVDGGAVSFGNEIIPGGLGSPTTGGGGGTFGFRVSGVIPEPSSLLILTTGLIAMVTLRRRSS